MKIDFNKIEDIDLDTDGFIGYPDFADAQIISCSIYDSELVEWRDATEFELDIINEDRQFVYETVLNELF